MGAIFGAGKAKASFRSLILWTIIKISYKTKVKVWYVKVLDRLLRKVYKEVEPHWVNIIVSAFNF